MNWDTTIAIPLTLYYAFVNDIGHFVPQSMRPTASILSKALVELAKAHPDAYRDMTLSEKRHLRTRLSDCAPLAVGRVCIDELACLSRVKPKEVSMVARALLCDYLLLDQNVKTRLLE